MYNGERIVSWTNDNVKTGSSYAKDWNWTFIPYRKVNSESTKDLNVRLETVKILDKISVKDFMTLVLAMISRMYTESTGHKAEVDTWIYIKLKSFCTTMETMNSVKVQPEECEKYFQ